MGFIQQAVKTGAIQQPTKKTGAFDKIANIAQNVQDIAVGAAKGAASTLTGGVDAAKKGLDFIADKTVGGSRTANVRELIPESAYTPKNTAEKVGFGAEQVAEFLLPTNFVKEAEIAITAASRARKLGTLGQAVFRVAGKAGTEAAAMGSVRAAQTAGDVSETVKAALFGGLLRGATAAAGETLRAFRLPERLYNTVFKSTYDDAVNELKTTSLNTLKQTDPRLYDQAVKAKVIRQGASGEVIINPRLAREALDRGLKGSLQNMANAAVKGQVKSELLAKQLANAYRGRVAVPEPQYYRVLKQVSANYKNVGFGELAADATQYAKLLKSQTGRLTGAEALGLRRFLDKMRFASSYVKEPTQLSQSQANFKFLSDALRKRVNAIPGMKDVMNDYRFYIDALEALANEAKRRGNRQVLSLIDSLFFSTGLASGNPALGITAGVGRKLLNMPAGATNLAHMIDNIQPTMAGRLLRGAAIQATASQEQQEVP